ncbi:MAG TPA: glycosyltransferase family 2 protein [Gemmatimonadota bacterium]|nr:glycosyltransferase family 2 protein [Gemmatimonadota bacterium]
MSETPRPLLSIVVPIKDEIGTLPELTRRLSEVLVGDLSDAEVVFVDDGSRDESARWIAERNRDDGRVRLVRLSRNFGHQAAVTAGLAHARGRAVVLMDGDLQDPPETIPALVARWREGNEIVHTVKTRRRESWLRRVAFSAFYRLIGAMSHDADLPAQAGLFSLLDRRVVDELDRMPERNRYLAGLRSWVGFRQAAVEYERDARFSGAPRVSVARLFRLAFDGIFSFSNLPLRLATLLGLTVSLAAFLLMITVVWLRLFTDRAILGWASLMTSVLFLGGVILVTIGIIGEYTGRIYDEVKRRPLYIVAERIGIGEPESEAGDRRL